MRLVGSHELTLQVANAGALAVGYCNMQDVIIVMPMSNSRSTQTQVYLKTRKLCYRKDDRAMRAI